MIYYKHSLHHLNLSEEIINSIINIGCFIHPTGSKYICSPPELKTDEDWLVYCPSVENIQINIITLLLFHGYKLNISDYMFDNEIETECIVGSFKLTGDLYLKYLNKLKFCSFKNHKTCINFILSSNIYYSKKFIFATQIAKRLNLVIKKDRVNLFNRIITYDNAKIDLDIKSEYLQYHPFEHVNIETSSVKMELKQL